jgi:hypothetical protein
VVNGEMSLRRLKLSIYEVVKSRGGGGGGGEEEEEEEDHKTLKQTVLFLCRYLNPGLRTTEQIHYISYFFYPLRYGLKSFNFIDSAVSAESCVRIQCSACVRVLWKVGAYENVLNRVIDRSVHNV